MKNSSLQSYPNAPKITLKIFYIKKPLDAQDSLKRHFSQFHTLVELPAPNRIECTGNIFPASNRQPRIFSGKFRWPQEH